MKDPLNDTHDGEEHERDEHGPFDPGPDVVDPAPWLGQVGEGATLPSGEAIAETVRELTHPNADAVERIGADRKTPLEPDRKKRA